MAIHHFPGPDDPLIELGNGPKLRPSALLADGLLRSRPRLRVWKVQCKPDMPNTAWYIGYREQELPTLLHFVLIPSTVNVEFMYPQFLPPAVFDQLPWQNSSWKYARLNKFGRDWVLAAIDQYLAAVAGPYTAGKLKQGGRSAAEAVLKRYLQELYPGCQVLANHRPDDLRSDKGVPLELDLFVPQARLAIEVQGPQHFAPLRGPNDRVLVTDQQKVVWCRKKGIKFLWMNWQGLTKTLFRLPAADQLAHLRSIFDTMGRRGRWFATWTSVTQVDFA